MKKSKTAPARIRRVKTKQINIVIYNAAGRRMCFGPVSDDAIDFNAAQKHLDGLCAAFHVTSQWSITSEPRP